MKSKIAICSAVVAALLLSNTASAQESVATESTASSDEAMQYAGHMYRAYIEGGVSRMQEVENECWGSVSPGYSENASQCALYAMTGAFIEAGHAKVQGRMPAPYYQGPIAALRVKENSRLPEDEAKTLLLQTAGQAEAILLGLANAGMR